MRWGKCEGRPLAWLAGVGRAASLGTDALPTVQAELELLAGRPTLAAAGAEASACDLVAAAVLVHEMAKRVMPHLPGRAEARSH